MRKKRAAPKAGPYISTARAKKTPGKTVKVGGTQVIKSAGKKPLAFKKGGLHSSLGVPQGQKIPAAKLAAAVAGKYGAVAKKRALFAKNVLAKGRKTARKGK
uniref:Uncharacterized protein n=1 Tax=viral metagenome TaxID=1070528 RepID=A0A6M3J1S4_9ZZZZ